MTVCISHVEDSAPMDMCGFQSCRRKRAPNVMGIQSNEPVDHMMDRAVVMVSCSHFMSSHLS